MMTDAEKLEKFAQLQEALWFAAREGNPFQSAMAAAIIRQLGVESPEGDDPESA